MPFIDQLRCHPTVLQGEISRICSKSSCLLTIFCVLLISNSWFLFLLFTAPSLLCLSSCPQSLPHISEASPSDPTGLHLIRWYLHPCIYWYDWWYPDLLCRGDLDTSEFSIQISSISSTSSTLPSFEKVRARGRLEGWRRAQSDL